MNTTGIVLQARMGSTRLPGKVLMPLADKPMLERILDRLRTCRLAGRVILATGDDAANDPVAKLGASLSVAVFRGSEADVLDRYWACAATFGLNWIVRATGDNPFVDAEECDRLIAFARERSLDYASAFPSFGSGLPIGTGVEIMSRAALERSWREGRAPHHREHVNEYIQEHPGLFRQETLLAPAEKTAPDLSFTVDTPDDFDRVEALWADWLAAGGRGEPGTAWLIGRARRRA